VAKKKIKQVRQHAKRHQQEHGRLKNILNQPIYRERVMGLFVGTFLMVLVSILIFFNWSKIIDLTQRLWTEVQEVSVEREEMSNSEGYQHGIEAGYLINGQTANEYIKQVGAIKSNGYQSGVETSRRVGLEVNKEENVVDAGVKSSQNLIKSLIVSTSLGNGNHLTQGKTEAGNTLQKTIVTSYYLGRNPVNLNSILETDLELLSKINNALAVDVFAYLNQSVSRADTLDDYLNLLERLSETGQKRLAELQSQINALTSSFEAQERQIKVKEERFFQTVENFEGGGADEELADFIELQKNQSETRAKIGAYQSIVEYYDYFLPRLSILIETIQANRGPLIAGVRVVEIDNMQLELIIEN